VRVRKRQKHSFFNVQMTDRNDVLTLEVRKYRRLSSIPPLTETVARLPGVTAMKLAILDSSVLTAVTSHYYIITA